MKTAFLAATAFLLMVAFNSCKKDDDKGGSSREVKFELTGNYAGGMFVVITDNTGNNEAVDVPSIPWTREITYPANITAIGIGANTAEADPTQVGKTITLNIYVGGKLVKTSTRTCDENGVTSLPPLAHNL